MVIGQTESGPVTLEPEKLISTRMLVQANSGGGKSWLLRLLCEQLGRSVPLIVFDREGEFGTLRETLDVLLVGPEGEIRADVSTAGALATQVLEIGVSTVIDLYNLRTQEQRAFVRRFLESMMAAPKRLWRPYFVIVDEAHLFVPEAGQSESADAVNALMCQGRKRQFCGILATQRLSKLHKDAAAEANNCFIGRCTLDVDQKRAGDVLGMGKAEYTTLRQLREGRFYAFGPALNVDGPTLFTVGKVQTSHGKAAATLKPPAPSARMSKVAEQLKDLSERAKTEVLDLDTARETIRRLQCELEQERSTSGPAYAAKLVREELINDLQVRLAGIKQNIDDVSVYVGTKAEPKPEPKVALSYVQEEYVPPPTQSNRTYFLNDAHTTVVPKHRSDERALAAFLWYELLGISEPTDEQLCYKLGYRPTSSTMSVILSRLRKGGYIDGRTVTEKGRAAVEVPKPGTLAEFHAEIRSFLDGTARRAFDSAMQAHPRELTATELCQMNGWSETSSTLSVGLSALRRAGLMEKRGHKLTAAVFPRGLR